jgi:hypothetical protein
LQNSSLKHGVSVNNNAMNSSTLTYIYNLLFKSCRIAPHRLRKADESTIDPPIIYLY